MAMGIFWWQQYYRSSAVQQRSHLLQTYQMYVLSNLQETAKYHLCSYKITSCLLTTHLLTGSVNLLRSQSWDGREGKGDQRGKKIWKQPTGSEKCPKSGQEKEWRISRLQGFFKCLYSLVECHQPFFMATCKVLNFLGFACLHSLIWSYLPTKI